MRKIFVLLGAALVLFVGFTVAVTARYHSEQPIVEPVPEVAIPDAAAERLARFAPHSDDLIRRPCRVRRGRVRDVAPVSAGSISAGAYTAPSRDSGDAQPSLYLAGKRLLSQSDPADRAPGTWYPSRRAPRRNGSRIRPEEMNAHRPSAAGAPSSRPSRTYASFPDNRRLCGERQGGYKGARRSNGAGPVGAAG